jgi:hypothetical protein
VSPAPSQFLFALSFRCSPSATCVDLWVVDPPPAPSAAAAGLSVGRLGAFAMAVSLRSLPDGVGSLLGRVSWRSRDGFPCWLGARSQSVPAVASVLMVMLVIGHLLSLGDVFPHWRTALAHGLDLAGEYQLALAVVALEGFALGDFGDGFADLSEQGAHAQAGLFAAPAMNP